MTMSRWRLALTAGALVTLGAVGGGLARAAVAPGSSPAWADPAAAAAADADSAPLADPGILLDTLALTTDPTSSGAALPVQLVGLRERLQDRIARVRGHLVHGSLTVLDRDGTLVSYQLDHGHVASIGGGSLAIAEAGGSSVTVATSSSTRVRTGSGPATLADVKVGDDILVRSIVNGGAATAKVIIVLPPSPAAPPAGTGNG